MGLLFVLFLCLSSCIFDMSVEGEGVGMRWMLFCLLNGGLWFLIVVLIFGLMLCGDFLLIVIVVDLLYKSSARG